MAKGKSRRRAPQSKAPTKQPASGGAQGVDANERKRERLEARRAAKAEAVARARARQRRETLVRWLIVAGLVAVGVWFFFIRTLGPDEFNGHPVEEFSLAGVQQHLAPGETTTYPTKPPVSGEHAGQPAGCGTYAEQIADEVQVHTLEHGAVGVQYAPDLDPEQIERIEAIVSDYDTHTFSAPYEGMESPIAVTSWGRMMRLDEVDEEAIRAYIDEFREQGPEKQACPNTQDQTFERTARSPTGAATPAAEADGGGGGGGEEGTSPSPTG